VVLLNQQGTVLDEVTYNDSWQFPLISNSQGVALERIDPASPSQDPSNWHSAASTAAYGTPTYQNSQFFQRMDPMSAVAVTPEVFSPDNDGYNDVTTISFSLQEPGFMANCLVLNSNGNLERHLVTGALSGTKGQWIWNGLDDKGQKLPVGIYIIYIEFYKLDGKKFHIKTIVTLAGKF
jgi:hypothetical protein